MLRTFVAQIGQGAQRTSAWRLGPERIAAAAGQQHQQTRGLRRWREKQLKEFYQRSRRFDVIKEPLRPRSAWQTWNYPGELYAFAQRLNEGGLTEESLTKMFTHRSYVEQMVRKQQELGIDEVVTGLEHNEQLIGEGLTVARPFIESYLRYFLRQAPEECIQAVADHLLSEEILCETAKWIGCIGRYLIVPKTFF